MKAKRFSHKSIVSLKKERKGHQESKINVGNLSAFLFVMECFKTAL